MGSYLGSSQPCRRKQLNRCYGHSSWYSPDVEGCDNEEEDDACIVTQTQTAWTLPLKDLTILANSNIPFFFLEFYQKKIFFIRKVTWHNLFIFFIKKNLLYLNILCIKTPWPWLVLLDNLLQLLQDNFLLQVPLQLYIAESVH